MYVEKKSTDLFLKKGSNYLRIFIINPSHMTKPLMASNVPVTGNNKKPQVCIICQLAHVTEFGVWTLFEKGFVIK